MINLKKDTKTLKEVKEEIKNIFNSNINYKSFNDNLYLTRAWTGQEQKESLCFTLNDKISIYVDENINILSGDIITGEWLDLDIEESKKFLNDIFKILASI